MLNTVVAGVTSLLTDMSTEMVYPLIPLYLSVLGAPPSVLGLIEGLAESTASILKVFSGWFSDRLGRRKPLAITGYACSAIGKLLFYVSAGWFPVFIGRMADRLGKGIRAAPRDALIADSTPAGKRGRAFGLHRAMDTVGAAAGVAIAILLVSRLGPDVTRAGFLRVFLVSLIPAGLGVLVLTLVRERRAERRAGPSPRLERRSLPLRLRLFLLVTAVFALGNSSNMFLLLRAKHIGFSVLGALCLYLVYNLTHSLFSYPAGRLSDRIGRKPLLVAGYGFYGLVYFGFALTHSQTFTWLLFGLYGLYSALTEGLEKALVADIAPAEHRATFIGLHATLVGIGLLPASLLAGAVWALLGASAPFWLGGGLGLAAAFGLVLVL